MATPPLTERPMRADARRNRERVLDAALHCFAADGLEAQMDDVASRAKVGVGTVYRHFPTKDALLEALADDYFARQAEAARAALEVEDPWEAFSGYVHRASDILGENRALAQVLRDRPGMMGTAALRAAEELGFFETLATLIDRAQTAGALRPDFRLEDIPLATTMSTTEIAEELCLSVNTVKTNIAAIYRKLAATRRRDAVLRAREFELL